MKKLLIFLVLAVIFGSLCSCAEPVNTTSTSTSDINDPAINSKDEEYLKKYPEDRKLLGDVKQKLHDLNEKDKGTK